MASGHQHASCTSSQMYTSHRRESLLPSTIRVPTMNEHNDLLSFLTIVQYHEFEFLNRKWDDGRDAIGSGANAEVRDLFISERPGLSSKVDFAFKRHRTLPSLSSDVPQLSRNFQHCHGDSSRRERIFNQLVAEVTILGHPLIRYHQNIVQLEAVYLETPESNSEPSPVVPVLVLEKADLGDLWCFASSSKGLQLSFEERLAICLDIGHALTTLHDHDMIHGDVKPQNVLIFRQNASPLEQEVIYAKLADFGFAAWNMDPTVEIAIYLPRSRPWDAPEYHHRAFSMKQAKQLDIFSFGLLCFWFLFHDRLESVDPDSLLRDLDADTAAQLTNLCRGSGFHDIKAVEKLKYRGLVPTVARELVIAAPLCDMRKQKLEVFFSSILNQNPDKRRMCVDYLVAITSHEALYSIQNLDIEQANLDHSTMDFRITQSFISLMNGKHQVRVYIASCFQNEALNGFSVQSRQNAAFQYSLCCKLGFGRASSDEDSTNWVRKSGKSVEHLEAEIAVIKQHVRDRYPFRDGRILSMRLGKDDEWNERITPTSRTHQNTMKTLIRETEDLARIFGQDNSFVVDKKSDLVVAVINSGLLDDAERLILDILEASATNLSLTKEHGGLPTDQPLGSKGQNKIHEIVGALDIFQPTFPDSPSELERLLALSGKFRYGNMNVSFLLAHIYIDKKRWKEAEKLLFQARTRLAHHLDESEDHMLAVTRKFGILYLSSDRYVEAEKVYTFLVRLCEHGFVKRDRNSLWDQMRLAQAQMDLGKYVSAESLLKDTMTLFESGRIENLTPELYHSICSHLSSIYLYQRRYMAAEILAKKTLSFCSKSLGQDNESILKATSNLATILSAQGSSKEAIKMLTAALQTQWCLDNQFDCAVLSANRKLALYLSLEGNDAESEALFQQVLRKEHAVLPAYDSLILITKQNMASLYTKKHRFKDAEQLFLPLIEEQKDLQDDYRMEMLYLDWKSALVNVYIRQRRLEEAKSLQVDVVNTIRRFFRTNHPKCLESESVIATICCKQRRYKDSEAMLAGKIDMFRSVFGETHEETTLALSTLVESLAGQRRWSEADEAILMLLDMIKDCDYANPSREWVMGFRAYILLGRGRLLEAVPCAWGAFPILDRSWMRLCSYWERLHFLLHRRRKTGYALAVFLPLTIGLMLKRRHFPFISRLGFIH